MKKILFILISVLILAACGSDKPQEEHTNNEVVESTEQDEAVNEDTDITEDDSEKQDSNASETEDAQNDEIDADEVKELLEYGALGENDELKSVTVENGEIKAVIEIGEHELIDDPRLLAETVYSAAGDELLQRDGWDVLTIDFVDVGTVSMNQDQKEANEFGEYFPSEEIMKQLGVE